MRWQFFCLNFNNINRAIKMVIFAKPAIIVSAQLNEASSTKFLASGL